MPQQIKKTFNVLLEKRYTAIIGWTPCLSMDNLPIIDHILIATGSSHYYMEVCTVYRMTHLHISVTLTESVLETPWTLWHDHTHFVTVIPDTFCENSNRG